MTRKNARFLPLVALSGVALIYGMYLSAQPATKPAEPAALRRSAPEAKREHPTPAPTARKAASHAAFGNADPAMLGATEPAIPPMDDGTAGNGPSDPQVFPGAYAPVMAATPAKDGTGGNGPEDPQIFPGAEAPAMPVAPQASNDGSAARGAPAPVTSEG